MLDNFRGSVACNITFFRADTYMGEEAENGFSDNLFSLNIPERNVKVLISVPLNNLLAWRPISF